MKRVVSFLGVALILLPAFALAASTPVNSATVMIANYTDEGEFLGWGSGFYVDEGIVVTNKHVIETGDKYRVFATGVGDEVDFGCSKNITKSDVKISLDDDVAYMRVYLDCEHGVINFAEDDPGQNVSVSVVGYRYYGTIEQSLKLTVTTGKVTGKTSDGWISTDALMDVGNSGGPVVHGDEVVGVAVAKGLDAQGNFVEGYFVPTSVILEGLLYANDSNFGYTPRSRSSTSKSSSSVQSSSSMSSVSSSKSSSLSSSSKRSSVSSYRLMPGITREFQSRTCARVLKWFRNDKKMMTRVNDRLIKRFGFKC